MAEPKIVPRVLGTFSKLAPPIVSGDLDRPIPLAPGDSLQLLRREDRTLDPVPELVAKVRVAKALRPSLTIPGVPTGENLPVTIKAAITVSGTAKVLRMSDEGCEIHFSVKGRAFFIPIEREILLSLDRQADGTYVYRYKDLKNGSASEGVANDIRVEGKLRTLTVKDKTSGQEMPMTIEDVGGGRFKITTEGLLADINYVQGN